MVIHSRRNLLTGIRMLALTALLCFPAQAAAAVEVLTGPSPIPGAEAANPKDITLKNEKLALTLSVASDVPWGVPAGGILDIAPIKDGEITKDRMTLLDFIPNNWSDWPATEVAFTIKESGPDKAVVQVNRMWGKVALQTTYTLEKNSNRVALQGVMTNKGDTPLPDIMSGFVIWPEGGALFQPAKSGVVSESRSNALKMDPKANKFTVAYDQDWAVTLFAPYADIVNYEGKDLYLKHTLAPGESRTFDAMVQVDARGESAPALLTWDKTPSGRVSGKVTAGNDALSEPVIVAEQNGEIVAWGQGKDGAYVLELPAGAYELYATGKGYLPSAKAKVQVKEKGELKQDFTDLKAPGTIAFSVNDGKGQALPARIAIVKGSQPPVRFLGVRTFFTELDRPGEIEISLAPGDYSFSVNSGAPFISRFAEINTKVESGKKISLPVAVPTLFAPEAKGWYSIDLHHHSDLLDGVTPPEYLVRSQASARLDYLFLSDHDTIDNLKHVDAIAKKYGFRFVPGLEISPSWSHFNIMPASLDKGLGVNPGTATVQEIFKAARDMGAEIIVANHPMIEYGYLNNLDKNKVPGGFEPGFDNFEINSDGKYLQAIPRIWEFWSKGQFYPFTAGTDIHDVWNYVSGRARLFVFMDKADPADQSALFKQIKAGRAYASMGPLVYPEIMFGDEVSRKPGEALTLRYEVAAADGLKDAVLISDGKAVETKTLNKESDAKIAFTVKPEKDTWYALTVTDAEGRQAWTNPVFVKMKK